MSRGINQGLALCHYCSKVVDFKVLGVPTGAHCPRCHSHVSIRLSNSLSRTLSLVITAAIVFIPANVLPIMTVIMLGKGAPDTIMSGVVLLVHHGMYPIAFLVFVASIVVPLFKLLGFGILLAAIKFRWKIDHKKATYMYRFIHFIGRWSMLDLFIISILVTLVNLGGVATITAGPGATAFATVVVLTVFAAHSFDQRLIWDLLEESEQEESEKVN